MCQKIALAAAFSPRMEVLLDETKRLVQLFHSDLILIHIGEKTDELEKEFQMVLHQHGLDQNRTTIIWKQGKRVKMILEACLEEKINLLELVL